MELDPRQSLELAFTHLSTFSVPGIGTFRKVYFSAFIDSETKTISPPGEKFVFEKGEPSVKGLEDFLFRFHKISHGKAKEGVGEIRTWLVKELKKNNSLKIEGVGQLKLVSGKELKFEAEDSLQAQSASFFGLGSIGTRMASEEVKEEEEKGKAGKTSIVAAVAATVAVAASTIEASAGSETGDPPEKKEINLKKPEAEKEEVRFAPPPPTEPVPDPVEEEQPQKSKRKLWVFLVLLILLLGAGGVIFENEIQVKLHEMGWLQAPVSVKPPLADANLDLPDPLIHSETETTDPDGIGDANITPSEPFEESIPLVEPEEDVEPDSNPIKEIPDVGTYATKGTYYLVVSSTHDAQEALQTAQRVGGEIIRPSYQGNFFRIYIAKSADKSAVIQKMVDNKGKHSKSWIFWPGM